MNIEESIKQIKTIIKIRKEQKEIIELSDGYCANCKDDIEALETLLTAYEKEKEHNSKLIKALDTVNHEKGVFIEAYEKEKGENKRLRKCHLQYEEMTGIDLLLPEKEE